MSTIKKSGIITICGRPNVGKSTLTNAFVGEKVAIVTNKPQTTRNRICGIRTRGESQFVFVDTPGLHKARTRLGDYMVDVVKQSVSDVDAVLLYSEKDEITDVFMAVCALQEKGMSVSAQTSEDTELRYREKYVLRDGRPEMEAK